MGESPGGKSGPVPNPVPPAPTDPQRRLNLSGPLIRPACLPYRPLCTLLAALPVDPLGYPPRGPSWLPAPWAQHCRNSKTEIIRIAGRGSRTRTRNRFRCASPPQVLPASGGRILPASGWRILPALPYLVPASWTPLVSTPGRPARYFTYKEPTAVTRSHAAPSQQAAGGLGKKSLPPKNWPFKAQSRPI